MPRGYGYGPGQGYINPALAGFEGLQQLIADRKKQELDARMEIERQQKMQLDYEQFQEQRRHAVAGEERLAQIAQSQQEWKEAQEQELVRKTAEARAEAARNAAIRAKFGERLKTLPGLSEPQRFGLEYGIETGDDAPFAQLFQKPEKSLEDIYNEQLARTQATIAGGGGPRAPQGLTDEDVAKAWTPMEDPNSPTGMSMINRITHEVKPLTRGGGDTEAPLGGPGRRASQQAEKHTETLAALNELEAIGEETGWAGLGFGGGIRGGLIVRGMWTPTDPKEVTMMSALTNFGGLVKHKRYGAALTGGEKADALMYIASANTPGGITKEMVASMKRMTIKMMRASLRGPQAALNETSGGVSRFTLERPGGVELTPDARRYSVEGGAPAPTPKSKYSIEVR